MSRVPTPAETVVLTALAGKVQAIVQAATPAELTATGLLAEPPVTPQDHADFEQRFQLITQSLLALIAGGRVRVNPDLSSSMEANTPVGYVNGQEVASIEVNGTFLDGDMPSMVTDRAITLLHELTHTIEPPIFPVKDFAYRSSLALSGVRFPVSRGRGLRRMTGVRRSRVRSGELGVKAGAGDAECPGQPDGCRGAGR